MSVLSLLCTMLLSLALGCGHYGSPRRPKPVAPTAQSAAPSQPAPESDERQERKKPSADGSLGAY